ncbi:MAG: PatB family C-S lyase [Rikenellaceae bacterium]|jgi:cystathionine beta-lyase|nr:PatB family C-S lyase [Rikenellaceae bacterium]
MYSFDKITDRRGTNCEKYDALTEVFGREEVIPLWVADSDFACPPFVVEAVRRRAEHPVYGYTFRGAEFSDAVRGWVDRRNGWSVEPQWIGFSPNVVASVSMAIRAVTEPGDGVVIQPPVYAPFARMTRMNDRKVLNNPLRWNGERYEIDFADFEAKIARAKAFLLCNPHNPTGRVFTCEELQRMADICLKHKVYILSDEIHSDLILSGHKHTHIASLSPEIAQRTLTFISPTKTFNLAGLSSSVTLIPDEALRRRFERQIALSNAFNGNIFGAVALVAAYSEGDRWLDALREQLEKNARFIVESLKERIPSVKTYLPEGTYLMWLDFREWGMEQEALFRLLVDAGLGLSNGIDFGGEGTGFMRLNIATSIDVLRQAIERLSRIKNY